MEYRKLGKTGIEVGEIGIGLEHLLDKEEKVVIDTIKTAVKEGINYLDCLPLSEFSESTGINECYVKLGKALEGIREKVYITFLAYVNRPLSYAQADFECYLRLLNTKHTDIFFVACCDKMIDFENATGSGSLLEYAKKLRTEGKVKYIGFSTHNTEIAYKVIDSGDFDVLMYPINPAFDVIADEEKYNSDILGNIWDAAYNYTLADKSGKQPRKNIFNECERNGIGLVAMKPFAGGFILGVEKDAGFTPLNLISYVLSQNGVSTVIPGCSNQQEVEEILKYYTCSKNMLDYSEAVIKSRWSIKGNCQYCNHCLPCSANINIAEINRLLDGLNGRGALSAGISNKKYEELVVKASSCKKCGECEKRCPFQVEIIKKMEYAVKAFEEIK
jgi:predicted aldo/keto reductase-like oxidoreductase